MDEHLTKENSSIELTTITLYGTNSEGSSAGSGSNVDKSVEADQSGMKDSTEGNDPKSSDSSAAKKTQREQWDNIFQFILSLIGFAVGLGNVWRFSYLCAKFGGSAFIIPYVIMLFVLGIPLFYLELSLGQAVGKGPIKAWYKLSPNLAGIGVSSLIVNGFIVIYYNVIIAWVFFFLFNTFQKDLPWGQCFGHRAWGNESEASNISFLNISADPRAVLSCFNDSTEFFWYNNALGASEDIHIAASFNWKIYLCLLLAWILIYMCLFRGIQSSGKVIYFTATFPYVVLFCLFFRAVTLEGAGDGLRELFIPSNGFAENLFSPQVWLEAATQIFFSLGLSIGALIALSSYTKPRYNNLANSFIVCLTNSFTSIFSSIIIFSIVGFRANRLDIPIELTHEGPGLAFVVFTEAILYMPASPLWGFLFFVMLLTLGLDSQFATVETIITVLGDTKAFKKIRKEVLVGIICFLFFLVSFPFVLGNGIYLFQLFDQFAGSIPLLLIGFFEFIAVGWVCGVRKFFTEYTNPYHKKLIIVWIVMWKWVDPIIMFIIFISSVIVQIVKPLTYSQYTGYHLVDSTYPHWAQFVGAFIVLLSVTAIPSFLIARLILRQSARDEAMEFITRQVQESKDVCESVRRFIQTRRGNWHPQIDEIDSSVPYKKEQNHYEDEFPAFVSEGKSD